MYRYRIDLTIGMAGYADADEWRLHDGNFEFLVDGQVRAFFPELCVRVIRRTGPELDLIVEYAASEPA